MLQIDNPDIPQGERTFRLFCHYFWKDHNLVRNKWLPAFQKTHQDWIYKVTLTHFRKTGRNLDSYLKFWLVPAFPINEVGIMLLARFFHGHVAIFVNEKWWSTHADRNLSHVNLFLVYRGQKIFDNSRLMTTEEYNLVRDDVQKYKLKIERQIKKQEEEEKKRQEKKERKKEVAAMAIAKPSNVTKGRSQKLPTSSFSSSSSSSSDSDDDLDLERIMDEGVLHNNATTGDGASAATAISSADKDDDIMQKNIAAEQKATNVDDIMQNTNITSENARKGLNDQSERLIDKGNGSDKDSSIPDEGPGDNNMQKSPAKVQYPNDSAYDTEDNMMLAKICSNEKEKETKDKPKKQTSKASGDTVKPKKHKKNKRKKFTCEECDKEFLTKNGLYKHEKGHDGDKLHCPTCRKSFLWNCELEDHKRRHTMKCSECIKCHIASCKKDYSSKRALQRHIRDDHGKKTEITCDFHKSDGLICGRKSRMLTLHKQLFTHEHEGSFPDTVW